MFIAKFSTKNKNSHNLNNNQKRKNNNRLKKQLFRFGFGWFGQMKKKKRKSTQQARKKIRKNNKNFELKKFSFLHAAFFFAVYLPNKLNLDHHHHHWKYQTKNGFVFVSFNFEWNVLFFTFSTHDGCVYCLFCFALFLFFVSVWFYTRKRKKEIR